MNNRKKNSSLKGKWGASLVEWTSVARKAYHQYANTSEKKKVMFEQMLTELTNNIYEGPRAYFPDDTDAVIKVCTDSLRDAVFDVVVPKYGELFVLMTQKTYCDAIKKFGNMCLTEKFHGGMPVWEYLKWYILARNNPGNNIDYALAEWSGIPIKAQSKVYGQLVEFFREELKLKYGSRSRGTKPAGKPRQKVAAEGLVVNVYEGGYAEFNY